MSRFAGWIKKLEWAVHDAIGADISTPRARRRSRWHYLWVDHGLLRIWWTNFDRVADGVYRSNQPDPKRLAGYRDRGIRSILNLRGRSRYSFHLFEAEACRDLGLELSDIHLSATELPSLKTLQKLEQHFRSLPRPFLMHCKSGADRAGFAAALYLMLIEGVPVEQACRQLSLRYLHIRASRKGILDFCLETYRKTNEASPIPFRDWMETMYDPEAITAAFNAGRSGAGR